MKNWLHNSRTAEARAIEAQAEAAPERELANGALARSGGEKANAKLARGAFGLAIGSLLLAGSFSLMLVAGRLPGISNWFSNPEFFKRCLVVHVDLALVIWFLAFSAGLFALLPAHPANRRFFKAGLGCAVAGTVGMVLAIFVPGAAPVLSNYVPVLDHPMFMTGLVLFFVGLLFCFLDGRLLPASAASADSGSPLSEDVSAGLKTVALAYVIAMTTFFGAWLVTPPWLQPRGYYELIFWGGGHALQVANVAAMLSVWLLLLGTLLGRPVVSGRTAWVLFGLLLVPHFVSPLLTLEGTIGSLYRHGFTRLMQFGVFPVVTVLLGICGWAVVRGFREGRLSRVAWRDVRLIGFAASALLTVAGFVIGSMIRDSNTLIPAHYHASIGAVTVGLMAATFVLLEPLGFPLPKEGRIRRLMPVQLYLFGIGQLIFAIGFGWAGLHGLGRKAYATEQVIRSTGEYVGLAVMGVGGLMAVMAGVIYLAIVVTAVQARVSTHDTRLKPKLVARRKLFLVES